MTTRTNWLMNWWFGFLWLCQQTSQRMLWLLERETINRQKCCTVIPMLTTNHWKPVTDLKLQNFIFETREESIILLQVFISFKRDNMVKLLKWITYLCQPNRPGLLKFMRYSKIHGTKLDLEVPPQLDWSGRKHFDECYGETCVTLHCTTHFYLAAS